MRYLNNNYLKCDYVIYNCLTVVVEREPNRINNIIYI